ncbi:MFS transporter [Bacillus sp. V3B]|uniref:MFS transporter n=1 Tax=Bacillus sp. V3B TaxID=2804915 RepID=UPI00210E2821|nr:MFS transporter [Bacillus sp. V3B]MCQ6275599.1 MFS transporter [Bacillus sp. V3B]
MNQKPKLWTKDFITISSAHFFIFLTFYLLMVTFAVYTMGHFDTSQSTAGLAASIIVLGAVIVRPIAGKTITKIGHKKLLVISLILFLLSSIAYQHVSSLSMLFLVRFIHGIAFGISTTATGSIASEIIPNERRGEGTGYFAMSMNLAMAFGPFIGLIIMQYFDDPTIFIAATVFSIVAILAALASNVPKKPHHQQQQHEEKTGLKLSDFFEKKALPISLLMGFGGFIYSSILTFLTSYAQEIGLITAASFFFVMYAIFLLASRPFTGIWFDRYGDNFIMYPSIALFACGYLLLSLSQVSIMLLAAGALIGIGFGTFQSSTQAIAVKKSPHHRISLATSTYFTFYDLGIGVGPFLLGFIIPFTGFRGLYLSMTILAFICMVLYYFIHGKHVKRNDEDGENKLTSTGT